MNQPLYKVNHCRLKCLFQQQWPHRRQRIYLLLIHWIVKIFKIMWYGFMIMFWVTTQMLNTVYTVVHIYCIYYGIYTVCSSKGSTQHETPNKQRCEINTKVNERSSCLFFLKASKSTYLDLTYVNWKVKNSIFHTWRWKNHTHYLNLLISFVCNFRNVTI